LRTIRIGIPGTASFHVAEYGARGDLLVREEVVAEIAG
jgi:hypothetical protein